MKILIALCTICIIACKVETQSLNNVFQPRKSSSRQNLRYSDTVKLPDNGQTSYDQYIQEVLNKRRAEALAQKTNANSPNADQSIKSDDNINIISETRPKPSDYEESPIQSNPIRFVGVGKTDVEYLNNVTYAITNFGVVLMKTMNRLQGGNIIVSPTSIATVLALLQQATTGEAQNEITRSLQMTPDVTAPTYRRLTYDMKKRNSRNILTVSNNLCVGEGFEIHPAFRDTAIVNFGSEVTVLDFSRPAWAVKQINKWVAIQTHNKIEELLPQSFTPETITMGPPIVIWSGSDEKSKELLKMYRQNYGDLSAINHNTQLVIANAVYFKGLWETKFNPDATKSLIFHLSSGEAKAVQFMRMRHSFKYGIDEETNSYVAIMPFERHQYSLILLLPHQLSNVNKTLNSLTNSKLVSYHKFEEIEIQLEIPKFTIKSDTDMISVLKEMGVGRIFSTQTDLTGIGTYRTYSPQISHAVHTGFLSVDEQGLSAAAAAGFAAVALSYEDPAAIFQANRPFIAILWDTQFAIPLFIAKIDDPSQ